jgi:hypothetical protein
MNHKHELRWKIDGATACLVCLACGKDSGARRFIPPQETHKFIEQSNWREEMAELTHAANEAAYND